MHRYIEIVRKSDEEVIHRIDVSGQTDTIIRKAEIKVNIQIDIARFYTRTWEYDEPQECDNKIIVRRTAGL